MRFLMQWDLFGGFKFKETSTLAYQKQTVSNLINYLNNVKDDQLGQLFKVRYQDFLKNPENITKESPINVFVRTVHEWKISKIITEFKKEIETLQTMLKRSIDSNVSELTNKINNKILKKVEELENKLFDLTPNLTEKDKEKEMENNSALDIDARIQAIIKKGELMIQHFPELE